LLLIVVQVFTSEGWPEAGREMLASQSIDAAGTTHWQTWPVTRAM
jgi:hypothetical protein